MSAAPIRPTSRRIASDPQLFAERMLDVIDMRDEWLDVGLSSLRSDRPSAESAVAELYRRSGFREPEFVWVPSPPAGIAMIDSEGLMPAASLTGDGPPARITSELATSRKRMDSRIGHVRTDRSAEGAATEVTRLHTAVESARLGVGVFPILRAAVWDSLRSSLFDGVAAAIRTSLPPFPNGVTWYGQQEAHRIAYYDIYRRAGFGSFRPDDDQLLDVASALARATGWWWAFDEVCVMSDRPTTLCTESTPNRVHGERRLHSENDASVEFADGHGVFALHGTIVPEWVVREPTVERIARERNVEVRRCAIERIGWDTYIDSAGLALIDQADDPGNVGHPLQLYSTPSTWGGLERILLVVNGSTERDGRRRRYGLRVPRWASSALDAAGWTYGISGADYARLARRT